MVAQRRRAPQNAQCDRNQYEDPSTKIVEKSVESDESGPDGEAPTEADAVNVSVMVMGSDEEGFASDESDANSIESDEPAPDEAGYTADAEDGDGKGDDADDADDAEDNVEEDGVDAEGLESDEDGLEEVPPSPVDIPDSPTENDATAGEHDFESEGNEQVGPSENIDTEPGDDGNEQMSNEDDPREETDVADGENSEVENQAAAAQGGHDAFDEGEMSNGNSDTRDGEFLSDENSADEGAAEPAEAGSEDGTEMANGHVDHVDAPSPLEAGDNDEMTDATEERRSEGEAPLDDDSELVEPAEADDDDSDVEDDVDTDHIQNTTADEHSEIEDEYGDTSEDVEKIDDEAVVDELEEESDGGVEDENDIRANGRDAYHDDVSEVEEQGQDEESEGVNIPSHSGESEGEEDGKNVNDETHAASESAAYHEREDGQEKVAGEENGQEEGAEEEAEEESGTEESGTEESDDDINIRSFKLVLQKPAAPPSLPQSTDTRNGTTTNEPTKRKRREVETKSSKGGVIYLPRIPPGLDVTALRSLLSRTTQIKRIWLRPETGEQRRRRQSLGGSRRKQRFRDGWVELASNKEAKRVVGLLNGQPMVSGKRRGRWADDLWCLKYLKGFAWTDLTNEVFGGRERVLRVRERVMEGRRVKEWVESRGKGQGIKVRRFRQKRGIEDLDDVRAKETAENVDREMDSANSGATNSGATVDKELVGMLFKKRRT